MLFYYMQKNQKKMKKYIDNAKGVSYKEHHRSRDGKKMS